MTEAQESTGGPQESKRNGSCPGCLSEPGTACAEYCDYNGSHSDE